MAAESRSAAATHHTLAREQLLRHSGREPPKQVPAAVDDRDLIEHGCCAQEGGRAGARSADAPAEVHAGLRPDQRRRGSSRPPTSRRKPRRTSEWAQSALAALRALAQRVAAHEPRPSPKRPRVPGPEWSGFRIAMAVETLGTEGRGNTREVSTQEAKNAGPAPAMGEKPLRVRVLYGTQTGNSRGIAGQVSEELTKVGFDAPVSGLDQFKKVRAHGALSLALELFDLIVQCRVHHSRRLPPMPFADWPRE